MPAYQYSQQPLLFARKPEHVRIRKQIGTVPVITAVRDIETDLMQPRCPGERQLSQRVFQLPCLARLL